ncbi:hypothetical protein ACWC5I_38530 [Kitasatospora sp. NPDC001574]
MVRTASIRSAAAAAWRRAWAPKPRVTRAEGRIMATIEAVSTSTGSTQPRETNQVPPARLTSRTTGGETAIEASASSLSIGPTQPR